VWSLQPVRDQRPWRLVATCSRGLEEVVRGELAALGHPDAACGRGVVSFGGDLEGVYRANLWLRAATRVLRQLAEGPAASRDALYSLASTVAWEEFVSRGQTFMVEAAGKAPAFPNTGFAALTVKDALVDRLRSRWGSRPDVDRRDADLRIHVHLAGARAAVSLDSSGGPLAHRGYRPRGGPAPLAESLAAGILLLAEYDGVRPFLDPMAGTGTIAIEAALIATGTAPGLRRTFACERWRDHEPERLAALRASALRSRRSPSAPIVARDSEPRAVAAARHNARAAGVGDVVAVERGDVRDLRLPADGALIVTNPPYGQRLGDPADLATLYRAVGDALKHRASGATAWLLVGNRELAKSIGLRASRRIVLFNGPIECRLLRFDLYSGSRETAALSHRRTTR
jgi:putative N6-adenine-specific DNA methylase